MRPVSPFFVEHDGLMYEAVELDDEPRDRIGKPRRCVINFPEQRIEFAPGVAESDRTGLICRALTAATGKTFSRLLPMVGAVNADEFLRQ